MNFKLIVILIVLAGWSVTACDQSHQTAKSNKTGTTKKTVQVPEFNADSAYYFVEKQVSFGPRVPGTEAHTLCSEWLVHKFKQYSDTVIVQKFKARTYDKVTRRGENIIASFNPDAGQRILLMSHWDSRPFADYDPDPSKHRTPIDAANDGGSGVGVLLEAARQFGQQNPEVGVDIVLFDLEDWGPPSDLEVYDDDAWGLGSQYWAKNPHVLGYEASFGILLDMVGAANPKFKKEYFSMQYAEFVVDMVWEKAYNLGYGDYFLNEEGTAINDDHIYVNKYARIPSIDIIHLDPESSNSSFFEYWHTTGDNMEHIDKQTLNMVGKVILEVVYNQ